MGIPKVYRLEICYPSGEQRWFGVEGVWAITGTAKRPHLRRAVGVISQANDLVWEFCFFRRELSRILSIVSSVE